MEKFARWSGVAHDVLSKSHNIKLGQVHQVLAACFGHQSYASFLEYDLAALNGGAKFVFFDGAAGLARAQGLGFTFTQERFQEMLFALKPSGITGGTWLAEPEEMLHAARLVFEDAGHPKIQEIKSAIGVGDGHHAVDAFTPLDVELIPDVLPFEVIGNVLAFNDKQSLSVPVLAKVQFRKVGRRMYAAGDLLSVEQTGQPHDYEPDDPEDGGDFFWMSED